MRQIIAIATILILSVSSPAQLNSPPADSEVFTIKQSAISHSRPVSFSIGYPIDWQMFEPGSHHPVGELLTADDELVCSFCPGPTALTVAHLTAPNLAHIIIWRSDRSTAKEEAERFAASVRQRSGSYTNDLFSPITTKAGDHGYLVVSRVDSEQEHALLSDFFFHVGAKGAIRISIRTSVGDSQLFENLQNLVLQTLRFSDG